MCIVVERAKVEDLDAIIQGQKSSFYECYQRYQDHDMNPYNVTYEIMKDIFDNEYLYKIRFEDKLVGAIYVHENPDKCNMKLRGIFVIPEYQDKGIGQKAIEYVESLYSEARSWSLETPHDLKRNHHVYEKMGYVRTGQEDFVNDKLTIIHYKKEVDCR